MKDKTTQELIDLYNDLSAELENRRYFEYLFYKNRYDGEMTEVLAKVDAQRAWIEAHPQLAIYENIISYR